MKIFHLSDLHIGLKLINRDMREDQEYILGKVIEYAVKERPDVILIAGDIYDKAVPSAEAVEVFDKFVTDLSTTVENAKIMMISGNHDSAPRVDCYRHVLERHNIYMVGVPPMKEDEYIEKVTLEDEYGKVNFYLLPFVKPSVVRNVVRNEDEEALSYDETIRRLIGREDINTDERNVIVSHQFYLPTGKTPEDVERMDSEIRSAGNIDSVGADVLDIFDYSALGHIHKPMKAGADNKVYPGTLLACSVSEAGQTKGIVMIELGEKAVSHADSEKENILQARLDIKILPLIPLRQVKVIEGTLEEVLQKSCDDYVTVVLTEKIDRDVIDMKDKLYNAFPYLLDIRRSGMEKADYSMKISMEKEPDVYELCLEFIPEVDDEDATILRDVINKVKGVE